MGFGFNLLMMFVIMPASLVLVLLWAIFQKRIFGLVVALVWVPVFSIILLSGAWQVYLSTQRLKPQDLFGQYVIDRSKCSGFQSDWQYDHYRFSIEEPGKFVFYITDKAKVVKRLEGRTHFGTSFDKPTLIIDMNGQSYHIIEQHPTRYGSEEDDFYFVFKSPKYGNVFLRKGSGSP